MRRDMPRFSHLLSAVTGLAMLLAGGAIASAQTVIAWGNNSSGQTNVPAAATNVIAVAGGQSHSMALRRDGSVIFWGAPLITNGPPAATNVIAIGAGAAHSVALRADGVVLAWGLGAVEGQASVPASATNIIAIAAG